MRELLAAFVEEIWHKNQSEIVEYFIAPEFVAHLLGSGDDLGIDVGEILLAFRGALL